MMKRRDPGDRRKRRRTGRRSRGRRLRGEVLEDRLLLAITAAEQEFVYLLNLARHDPAAYQIEQGLSVDLSNVQPRPPLAVNDALFDSAGFHAEEMATYNYFDHRSQVTGDWPNKMARDHGYALPASWRDDANYIESIAAGTWYYPAQVPLNELIEDVGIDPPGHRIHLLGTSDFHAGNREIGVGYAYNASATFDHYWAIHATRQATSDVFATGVVYDDANGNRRYDAGEGLGGVTVTAGGQTTTTNAAGGWAIQVTAGSYTVTATGAGFSGTGTAQILVGSDSVEVDFLSGEAWGIVNFEENAPPVAAADGYVTTAGTPLTLTSARGVLANDTDPDQDPLTALEVTGPAHGTLDLRGDGSFDYTPDAGFSGVDQFTYRASDGAATSAETTVTVAVALPLGVTDFWETPGLNPSAGALWYRLQTARAGYLTAEASGTEAVVALYDAQAVELVSSQPGTPRIDHQATAANQTYYLRLSGNATDVNLRITNLVRHETTTVTVSGTAGDDQFQYAPFGSHTVTINGTEYHFPDGQVTAVDFQGGGGTDAAWLRGSGADEQFRLDPDRGSMTRPGLAVNVTQTTELRVWGEGGSDRADLYDSAGDDTYTGTATYGRLVQPAAGTFLMAVDVDEIYVHSGGQGTDVARLYGTGGDETGAAEPGLGTFSGGGFRHQVEAFDAISLFADAIGSTGSGGSDRVVLGDSAGDDTLVARLDEVTLRGPGYSVRAAGFDTAEATASGGADEGWFYGTAGNDRYEGAPETATFSGTVDGVAYTNVARGFPWAIAFAKAGAADEAVLSDSPGADGFTGTFVYGRMAGTRGDGAGYFHRAVRFDQVTATSTAGSDVARFEDGPYDDEFHGGPGRSSLANGKATQAAEGFARVVAIDVPNPDGQGVDRDRGTSVAYLTAHVIREKDDGTRIASGQQDGQPYLIKVQQFDQYHYNQIAAVAAWLTGPAEAVAGVAGGAEAASRGSVDLSWVEDHLLARLRGLPGGLDQLLEQGMDRVKTALL